MVMPIQLLQCMEKQHNARVALRPGKWRMKFTFDNMLQSDVDKVI